MVAPALVNYNAAALVLRTVKRENVSFRQIVPKRSCCLSDRKYRQHGYQDSGAGEREKTSLQKPVRQDNFGPRRMQMAGTHSVSRCSQCGTLLTLGSEPLAQCKKCGFELHSCKQCTHFDPSRRFECMQQVPERIAKKDARNECSAFCISVRVEKQTSTGAASQPNSARQAFDNLFKD